MKYHTPVLLQEVITYLDPAENKTFIDATIGGGGHALSLLKRGARVLGVDRDPEAIDYLKSQYSDEQDLVLQKGNFNDIKMIAAKAGFNQVDGIIFDLGVSSFQLDTSRRGFSFQNDGPLDMRMDPSLGVTAGDIVNNFDKRRLYEIFETYGQEKFSWAIAGAIYSARQIKPISSTQELAKIIEKAVPRRGKVHQATRSFQALRIVVNSELLNLEQALPQTVDLLKTGGRLATISFHSLEDKIVKRVLKEEKRLKVLTKTPIGPKIAEIENNPRSRSAKLRVAERL